MTEDLENAQYRNKNNNQIFIYDQPKESNSQKYYPTASQTNIQQDFNNFRSFMKKKSLEIKDRSSKQECIITPKQESSIKRVVTQQEEAERSEDNFGLIQFLRKKQQNINNQFKVILRTLNIKKFMNIMKGKSKKYLFRWMSQLHFDIIGDVSSDYSFFYYNDVFYSKVKFSSKAINKQMIKSLIYYLNQRPTHFEKLKFWLKETFVGQLWYNPNLVIHPDSKIKIIWDIIFILLMINMIIYLPLHNSFDIGTGFQNFVCYQLVNIIFPLEILLNLNTAIFKRGHIITRRKLIIRDYLRNKFVRDFMITLIFFLNNGSQYYKYLDYIVLLRIFDILKKFTELDERFNKDKQVSINAKIIKLVFIMFIVGHLSACCFVEIGQIEKNAGKMNWLDVSTSPQDSWHDVYITSIYWATITMVTLGYGDIVPVTSMERVFVIIMSLSSCGIFAYSFNQIGEIIQEMQRSKSEFQQKMRQLNYLMSKRGIDTQLQTKIRKYYEYHYQQKYQSDLDINYVTENLSSLLKEEVFKDLYGKKLRQHKIFSLNFNSDVIDALALRVKEQKFVAEEYIFQEKEYDDKIYILVQKEEVIGEEEFFNESHKRQYSLKSCNSSLVAFLTRRDFYEVLQDYPEQYEFYRQLKDKIMLYNQHQTLGIKCIICDKFSHKYDNCPFLNIEQRKHLIIHNSNKSQDQKRVKVSRFQQRYNSRNNVTVVQNAMNLFEIEYESRLNLRTESEASETYEAYEVKSRSKVGHSQVEFNGVSSQVNNLFLHEPLGSFCNFKHNELSSYKDNISQMDKSEKEDILSQISLRGAQLQNQQSALQPSQLILQQPQVQTLQVLIDYKSEISNKSKRNSDVIQIKLPVQPIQKAQALSNNQSNQQQSVQMISNQQTNQNQQQIFSINIEPQQNSSKNQKQNIGSFTDLDQSFQQQQNFQRKDDKKKSTRLKKRSTLIQQDSVPSGLNAISSSNNQLQVNRQGSRNQSCKFNDIKNAINEKSQASQIQNGLIFYLEFCQFDYEEVFDVGKEFKKYFVSNNLLGVIKQFNQSQLKNRNKAKTQNMRKSKKKIGSPSKQKKSFKHIKSPSSYKHESMIVQL
ncbi:cation channel family transporter (macronuclear) [Tetrahymena thermophila SB210]|uniref:Cation channel family transporter n=1 Tax=Tetrahymena thermophila (strain SB210) TaxID=312017 RepID=Q24GH0_TETTS|nr:cation channel family transporter [Tetrahymena thermophila SB210]EAS06901.2 cation channel family transporter [Tetrahymena thermophila SB210]|eukprot:XP_001027143.2 cation channel family transporter [Tetrahymena thermophila SB210]